MGEAVRASRGMEDATRMGTQQVLDHAQAVLQALCVRRCAMGASARPVTRRRRRRGGAAAAVATTTQ